MTSFQFLFIFVLLFSFFNREAASVETGRHSCQKIHGISFHSHEKKREIERGSENYKKILSAYKTILSTPTALYYMLRQTLLCDKKIANIYLGLGESDISNILLGCEEAPLPKKKAYKPFFPIEVKLQSNKTTFFPTYEKMKYFYINNEDFLSESSYIFDSWSHTGEIILYESSFSEKRLIPILVHELSIQLDAGFQYQSHFADKITSPHYNQLKKFDPLLGSPVLQSAFSSLRAFQLEWNIINEISDMIDKDVSYFYSKETLSFLQETSCVKKIDEIIKKIKPFSLAIWNGLLGNGALLDFKLLYNEVTQNHILYKWNPPSAPLTCREAESRTQENLELLKEVNLKDGWSDLCRQISKIQLGAFFSTSKILYGGGEA